VVTAIIALDKEPSPYSGMTGGSLPTWLSLPIDFLMSKDYPGSFLFEACSKFVIL
jgi:hypothetical protein